MLGQYVGPFQIGLEILKGYNMFSRPCFSYLLMQLCLGSIHFMSSLCQVKLYSYRVEAWLSKGNFGRTCTVSNKLRVIIG